MTSMSRRTDVSTPVIITGQQAMFWMFGAVLVALALYYFIGMDQGATSLLGSDMHIHEFVHDSRHFLGFPCH
ncbi:MAG TPA: CbtB domain-containing protein [Streptosporangiaceae bacterium]|jgi:Probable cobalt transporter subunit (CbtB)|nr:CbtB domain-containing protein [Streptosporangiaceae bacterium]